MKNKNIVQFIAFLTGILFLSLAVAADKVDFISSGSTKKPVHVVTVSARGGDFADPVAAVNFITDAAAANTYLVLIDPGVYTLTQTLVMKPFVNIAGSGREATTLTGAISTAAYDASSAIVSGVDNAAMRDLTIENTGGSAVSIALYNDKCSPVIQNVTARATGGRYSYGVYNSSSSPIMTDVTARATGGTYSYDVFNTSSPSMTE